MADGIDFDAFPRFSLCHRPTPIEPMPRLGERLGGPRLFVKRDDCTGLAFGGNKTRKLEFLLGEALARGADTLVTQGAVQSNHVRQTAAAACRAGLACHALLERRVADPGPDYEDSGNVLLDRLFGATLEYRPAGLDMNAEGEAAAEALARRGRRPYFVPGGGSCPTGALGYALCAAEILDQSRRSGIVFDWIVLATGSSGTQAGLVAGLHGLGSDLPVIGISVSRPQEVQTALVHDLARRTATERLGSPPPSASWSTTAMSAPATGFPPPTPSKRSNLPPASRGCCSIPSTPARAWPA